MKAAFLIGYIYDLFQYRLYSWLKHYVSLGMIIATLFL